MKKTKYIKLKSIKESGMTVILQNWILEMTTAGLISIEMHRLCRKFIQDLQKIPLSEELQ